MVAYKNHNNFNPEVIESLLSRFFSMWNKDFLCRLEAIFAMQSYALVGVEWLI